VKIQFAHGVWHLCLLQMSLTSCPYSQGSLVLTKRLQPSTTLMRPLFSGTNRKHDSGAYAESKGLRKDLKVLNLI
jgi:hypothetical protein